MTDPTTTGHFASGAVVEAPNGDPRLHCHQHSLAKTTAANFSVSTPTRYGRLQDVKLDFAGDLREFYGQAQFALALARGKIKIEGKASFARISDALFNHLFFG
ncbi:MAG: hypothetical protein JWO51_118 [Rhodospirillales bacterium]|nr:hypothetical protein [Rhodospirillales bacterium]